MPGLQSFCVCTALGLASIYLLQVGWFVAWLAVDEERVRASKNGFVPGTRTEDGPDQEARQGTITQSVIRWYRAMLSCTVYRVVIVLTSLCCLVSGV